MGLFDCIGAKTRVLTDRGWKRITSLTVNDLVWDGNGFVRHAGVIRKGVRKTISFKGLAFTPDHKIWTAKGWVAAEENPDAIEAAGIDWIEPEDPHEVGDIEVYDILNAGPLHRFTVALESGQAVVISNCDCVCAAAPDTKAVADASLESAKVAADLGREQLAESRRQYDQNMTVAKPVVDAQLALMDQTKRQGDDYYNYMVSRQRPVEDALNADALKNTSAADAAERALITGGNTGVYEARKGDIEDSVGRAVADARTGQSSATNQMIRQGIRYGWSPAKIAAMTGTQGLTQASQIAAAANGTRNAEIEKSRGLMTEGRNMRLQDEAKGWAKKLDVAGLYRGLPGASQGAYSLANQSGNSAVANTMAPGAQLQTGMAQGANTTMSGQQMAVGGLSNVLNAQTSYANSMNQAMNSGGGGLDGLGSLIGAGVKLYSMSDRRMKENIKAVGKDENTGLTLYEFTYLGAPGRTFRGFMADEVESRFPEAVAYDDLGFASVDYGMLGTKMVEV